MLGRTNDVAAKEIKDSLQKSGVNLPGTDVYVFPVIDTKESLLVFEVDGAKASSAPSASSSNDESKFLQVLGSLPAIKSANVTRVAINFTDTDKQGPYVLTMTMPMATLDLLAKGTLSPTQAQQQVLFYQTRGGSR